MRDEHSELRAPVADVVDAQNLEEIEFHFQFYTNPSKLSIVLSNQLKAQR